MNVRQLEAFGALKALETAESLQRGIENSSVLSLHWKILPPLDVHLKLLCNVNVLHNRLRARDQSHGVPPCADFTGANFFPSKVSPIPGRPCGALLLGSLDAARYAAH